MVYLYTLLYLFLYFLRNNGNYYNDLIICLASLGISGGMWFEDDVHSKLIGRTDLKNFYGGWFAGEIFDEVEKDPHYKMIMFGVVSDLVNIRWFFYTHSGYLGVGPLAMRDSDEVVVISECGNPLLFREVDGNYYLVGSGYVIDLMDAILHMALSKGSACFKQYKLYW